MIRCPLHSIPLGLGSIIHLLGSRDFAQHANAALMIVSLLKCAIQLLDAEIF